MNPKISWYILALVFLATGLNFLDRQVLSMTIIKIQEELSISDVEYGWVNTGFLISYALMFTVGGRLIDKVGGKLGLGLSVGVWSVASALHGVMSNFYHLLGFRFLLGMGEGGWFPCAAKTVYERWDIKERALANGLFGYLPNPEQYKPGATKSDCPPIGWKKQSPTKSSLIYWNYLVV
ncbi:MFS transporter [Cyclobacterium jeungdonense]|uniref:MFS transporter n=1 Tax=Cyclobacterium jeungdonense TaxID=708087 RepID=A0ABT8C6T4_9BACT|nr:MFS transporter [Cyclobacterium jeungdonense]MDN3688508.1 MFS transporter [Cyclobacterium jeungdonense]